MFPFILWLLSTAVLIGIKAIGAAAFSWWWVGLPTVIYLVILALSNSSSDYFGGFLDGLIISDLFDDWDD